MTRKFLLLFIGVFLVGSLGFSQEIQVQELEHKNPLAGVQITVKKSKKSIFTSNEGKANLSDFTEKNDLILSLSGYQTLVLTWEQLEAKNYLVFLEPSPFTLQTTVISASRWNQNAQDVPGKIRGLDRQELLLKHPVTTADWLGGSGEVFIQKSQLGGGSPMIRGFSANRLLYSIDGVRMNTAIFRSGNLQQVISIDPFAIKNTEILFGPGAVMYGSDAIGGVMLFETLSPDVENQSFQGNVLTRYSSAYAENTYHLDFTFGKGKWSFLSSASYFNYGDLIMGKNKGQPSYLRGQYLSRQNGVDVELANPNPRKQVGTAYSQVNLMQKIRLQISKHTQVDYAFHYSTTSNVPRYDRLIEKRDGKLRFARWDYGPQRWMMQQLAWKTTSASPLYDEFKLNLAYQYFEESRIERRVASIIEFRRKEQVHAFSINADFLKTIRDKNFLSYGIEAVQNRVSSNGETTNITTLAQSPTSSRYPESIWDSWALYSNYSTELSTQMKMQGALRVNLNALEADFTKNLSFYPLPVSSFRDRYFSLTGNLGIVFQPHPNFSLSPLISTGFRAPNVDDMGKIFDSAPGTVLIPNPSLGPEYAYNSELNMQHQIGGILKVDLTGYYTLLDQAMVRRESTLNGQSQIVYNGQLSKVFALQNAAFAEIKGLQAGIELVLHKHLLFTSRYNWQRGKEELDDKSTSPSRHAAPAFGTSKLSFKKANFQIDFHTQYSAEVPFEKMPQEELGKPAIYATNAEGNLYSPSWIIFSLNGQFQLSPRISLVGGIENIGDLQYRPYSSGLVSPGRNFQLTLKGNF